MRRRELRFPEILRISGRKSDGWYCFSAACALEKSNPPYTPPDLMETGRFSPGPLVKGGGQKSMIFAWGILSPKHPFPNYTGTAG